MKGVGLKVIKGGELRVGKRKGLGVVKGERVKGGKRRRKG